MACSNMVIVFSGFRDETLKEQIISAGGKVAGSLVKNATHILVKAGSKANKKVGEAKEKGIMEIDLDEFVSVHDFHLADKHPKVKKEKTVDADDAILKQIDSLVAELNKLKEMLSS